jgi:ABC-type transport system substrate-binding protein
MHIGKKLASALLSATMMFTIAGCSSSSSSSATSSDSSDSTSAASTVKNLTMVISSDVGELSPFGGDSGGRHHTFKMLYDMLCTSLGFDATVDELEGQIAKSWTMPDNETIEVEIYDYVHDSQGNEIKASDVAFSYQEQMDAGTNDRLVGYIDSIEVTGDYTLTFHLASTAVGAAKWVLISVPIISQSWYESASDEDKTNNPAGTGAYTLVETVASSHTTLKKNEDYWQTDESLRSSMDAQPFDTIVMNVVTEPAMRVIALQNGEADFVQNVPANEISSFIDDSGNSLEGWSAFPKQNGRNNVLMFNNDNSVFADNQALRQAVLYAIDFESVRLGYGNTALNGSVCYDFAPNVASGFNEKWIEEDYYGYDVEKAKELLKEAGYEDGGGLTLRLLYQNSTTATAGLTVLQSNLADVGITVELTPADQSLFNSYKYDDTKWDIIVDSKGGYDNIIADWQNCFNSESFTNGSACFTHDDKLQELLDTAADLETTSEEAIDEFHYYLKDMAYGVGFMQNYTYYVGQDGIIEAPQDNYGNVTPNLLKVADDYQSVVTDY